MEIKCGEEKEERSSQNTKRKLSNALEVLFCAFDIGFENSLAAEE